MRMQSVPKSGGIIHGAGTEFREHQYIIRELAKLGWRYVGFIPVTQKQNGALEQVDLVFERKNRKSKERKSHG